MKKIFGKINITWKFLIIFSIILGIGVGILKRIPFLDETSFQDIAICFDMWIVLAIFIIVNSKSWKEAVLKCFVFFLISQPLIYFTEIVIDMIFKGANFKELCKLYFINYYVHAGWLTWTILTIPGSFIAYQVKKNNILSALILSVATFFLSANGINVIFNSILYNFPYHLLNGILCIVMAYVLIFAILTSKKPRLISIIITSVGLVIGVLPLIINSNVPMIANEDVSLDGEALILESSVEDENIATTSICPDKKCVNVYSGKETGITTMQLIDENGNKYEYEIKSTNREFNIKKK